MKIQTCKQQHIIYPHLQPDKQEYLSDSVATYQKDSNHLFMSDGTAKKTLVNTCLGKHDSEIASNAKALIAMATMIRNQHERPLINSYLALYSECACDCELLCSKTCKCKCQHGEPCRGSISVDAGNIKLALQSRQSRLLCPISELDIISYLYKNNTSSHNQTINDLAADIYKQYREEYTCQN